MITRKASNSKLSPQSGSNKFIIFKNWNRPHAGHWKYWYQAE